MGDDAGPPEDAQDELRRLRRDLERDFDAKMRDLKAQYQHRFARLKEEQAAWEEHRRTQAKALADKTETVRRRTENVVQRADLGAAVRKELEASRGQVKGLETAQRETAAERDRLRADAEAARASLRAAQSRGRWAGAALATGALGWLVAGWVTPIGLAILADGVALSLLLSFGLGTRRAG
jgi:hypothetical protein